MAPTTSDSTDDAGRSRSITLIVFIVLVLIALIVGLFYWFGSTPQTPPAAVTPPTTPESPTKPVAESSPLTLSIAETQVDAQVGRPVEIGVAIGGDPQGAVNITGDGLPDGASIEMTGADTGQFQWTPQAGQEGRHQIGLIASDGSQTARSEVTIAVAPPAMTTVTETEEEAAHFGFDRSKVSAADRNRLKAMVDQWQAFDRVNTVTLTGHTDATGTKAYNMALGQRRAQAVQSVLVDLGVPGDRITVTSKGESAPIATNADREGRARNRRCAVTVTARRAVTP